MSDDRPIRNLRIRFEIILYHLEKIQEDWGECRGLCGVDVSRLRVGAHTEIEKLLKSTTFSAFSDNPFIPESEFDNPKPQENGDE